jgi:glycosyltransferase involved in cell wall biosynthesis
MLEAMALGVPVVATNVGEVGEVVAHQETGLLVRPASGEELANAIIWALTDQTVRERIAKAGQQKVRRRFGVESMLNQTEAVYKRVRR